MSHLFSPVFLALWVACIPAAAFAHSVLRYPPPFDGTTTHVNKAGLCHGRKHVTGQPTKIGRKLTLEFYVLDSHEGECVVEFRDPNNITRVEALVTKKRDCVKVAHPKSSAEWTITIPETIKPGNWALRWALVPKNPKEPSHFESCAYVFIEGSKPQSPSTDGKSANWGEFRKDSCSAVGKRQYSAILWNINGSWEEACTKTPATINGKYFARPTRCKNTGTNMWGEFDVPDASCT
ncbi:hypothetical protein [Myxococcus sp. Y35]|uniref:hypothetical protein n=1 Tax=Pseudomyxococcus flavus TaxID=3115648 RepID=UPI003CEB1462